MLSIGPFLRIGMVTSLTFGSACTDREDSDAVDTADARDSGTIPASSTEYYEAWAEGVWGGTYDFTSHMAARRILDPSESRIDETFVDLDSGDVYEVVLTVDAEAGTFTLAYLDGSYEGEGVLHGEPWDWHAWESISRATDGTWVESADTRDESGIVAVKIGYDASGVEEWTMTEILTPVSEDDWIALQK